MGGTVGVEGVPDRERWFGDRSAGQRHSFGRSFYVDCIEKKALYMNSIRETNSYYKHFYFFICVHY